MSIYTQIIESAKAQSEARDREYEALVEARRAWLKELSDDFNTVNDGRKFARTGISPDRINYDALRLELKAGSGAGAYPYAHLTDRLGMTQRKLFKIARGQRVSLTRMEATRLYQYFGSAILNY